MLRRFKRRIDLDLDAAYGAINRQYFDRKPEFGAARPRSWNDYLATRLCVKCEFHSSLEPW